MSLLKEFHCIRKLSLNSGRALCFHRHLLKQSHMCERCLSCSLPVRMADIRMADTCDGISKLSILNYPLLQSINKHPNKRFFHTSSLSIQASRAGVRKPKGNDADPDVGEYINPLERLQQHVAVHLLKDKDFIFKPSISEVAAGQQLFVPKEDHNIQFLQSVMLQQQLPAYDLPEVAFIGRSNVGKSTMISMLLSHTDVVVKCSKHPGHTKVLNFFQVGEKFTLVDMPGYGFNMPENYTSLVEKFLASRKKLSRTFMLVDGTVGVTELDVIGLNMLEEFHIPYVIVLTKIDKCKPSSLIRNFMSVLKYRDQTQYCFPQPFLVSSTRGEGIPLLQAFIAYVTGNLQVQSL